MGILYALSAKVSELGLTMRDPRYGARPGVGKVLESFTIYHPCHGRIATANEALGLIEITGPGFDVAILHELEDALDAIRKRIIVLGA